MNNFERKLAEQRFRQPPSDLRETIFLPANVIASAGWTWRDWFWPSPQAWAALAAMWIVFAALGFSERESAPPDSLAQSPSTGLTLLTYHTTRDFDHVLELSN